MEVINDVCLVEPAYAFVREGSDVAICIEKAKAALFTDDIETFKDNLEKIDLDSYYKYDPHSEKLLLSTCFLENILVYLFVYDSTEGSLEMYADFLKAVLDKKPNLYLPCSKKKNYNFLDYLAASESILRAFLDGKEEEATKLIREMASLIGESPEYVSKMFCKDDLTSDYKAVHFVHTYILNHHKLS